MGREWLPERRDAKKVYRIARTEGPLAGSEEMDPSYQHKKVTIETLTIPALAAVNRSIGDSTRAGPLVLLVPLDDHT